MKRLFPWLAALFLGACVSLEETPMTKGAVAPGQRTVLLVYASPGPVITESDSKVETAAKIVPGLGLVVQSAQDERDLAASKDLQQYLPDWDPREAFYPLLAQELKSSGHPGRFVSPEEAELPSDTLKRFNRSENVLDWRLRYYLEDPERPTPRNYSPILSLDDAVIFEVNFAYGAASDGEGNATPNLSAVTKLYRANTMKTLWRHEDSVEDKAGAKTLYEFKLQPQDLMGKYQKLMPLLAQKIAASYRENLMKAGAFVAPPAPAGRPSTTTAVAVSTPTAGQWTPSPAPAPSVAPSTATSPGSDAAQTSTTSAVAVSTPTSGSVASSSETYSGAQASSAPAVSPSTTTAH